MALRADNLQLLVFDLDGTLIDSQADLANSVNATLAHLQLPTVSQVKISSFIGDGASMLVRRALAEVMGDVPDEETAVHALEFFLTYYRAHKLDNTYVYEGVVAALEQIVHARPNLAMAVLTNKPVRPSREICKALGLASFFFEIYGGDSFVTKKPDPEGYLRLVTEASERCHTIIDPANTVMIGDSDVDVKTARAAGAQALGCRYGLSPVGLAASEPDAMVDAASQWPVMLGLR